jgi:predicted nucleic acid-binding Zn ribbon protein
MFCDGCGSALQPGQAFCSRCGKQIMGKIATQSNPGRVQKHLHLLAVLWFAISALNALFGLLLVIVGTTLFPHIRQMQDVPPDVPVGFLSAMVTTFGILILAKAAAGFIAGRGLLHRDTWARVITLVLAFLSLFNVPFGTAIGVYTLWVLLPGQSREEYEGLATAETAATA